MQIPRFSLNARFNLAIYLHISSSVGCDWLLVALLTIIIPPNRCVLCCGLNSNVRDSNIITIKFGKKSTEFDVSLNRLETEFMHNSANRESCKV